MLLKFTFSYCLLKDLGILQLEKTPSYSASTVVRLAKSFQQLGTADLESLDCLREEFLDFTISPADLHNHVCTSLQMGQQSLELDHFGGKLASYRLQMVSRDLPNYIN